MDQSQTPTSRDASSEPFLLHESSAAFLHGDRSAIRKRFEFRRDAIDYFAMLAVGLGGLLFAVNLAQFVGGTKSNEESPAIPAMILGSLLIGGGIYYVTSRQSAAATRARLIDAGRVLPGQMTASSARRETSAEGALGEVTRTYVVTVEYRFTTPAGQEIADRDEHDRPDLRRVELPPADTPVRVLYLDDGVYALL